MWKLFLHPKIGSFFIYLYKIQVNSRQFVLRKPDLQIFSRFSFPIEALREEMRKIIIIIKVILVIFGVVHLKPLRVVHLKPFPSAVGFTLRKTDGLTLRKTDGLTLRKTDGFTLRKYDATKLLTASANGKTRKQKLTYSQMMR